MDIRENAKKTLSSILATLTIAVSSYGYINLPKGYEFFDRTNYHRFNRDITATKISKGKEIGWLVYDTKNQEIIGDEEDELNDYKKYATMAEAKEVMSSLNPEDIRNLASSYKKLLVAYEGVYNVPNFVLEEGSKLEGKLVKSYFTGGKDLPADAQKRIVKNLIEEEKKEIIERFYRSIFGDEEIVNPIQAAEKAANYFINTVEYRMLSASSKLDKSAEILEKSKKGDLSYEEYEEFLNNFIEGNSTARAYSNAIGRIKEGVDWKTLTQKIAKNLADGLGVKDNIEKVSMHTNQLLDIDLAGPLFGNKNFMDVFNNIGEEYLKERAKWFGMTEKRYSLDKGSVSRQIINDLLIATEMPVVVAKKEESKKLYETNREIKLEDKVKEEKPTYNIERIKKEICDELTKEDVDAKCSVEIINLNNDKIPEIKAWVPMYCGSGGCSKNIYGIMDGKEFLILDKFGDLKILNSKTNGYNDIITVDFDYHYPSKCKENAGSLWKAKIDTLLKWNGSKYVKIKDVKVESYEGPCN